MPLPQVSELSLKYTATQSELEVLKEQVPSLQTKLREADDHKNQLTRELSEKVGEGVWESVEVEGKGMWED